MSHRRRLLAISMLVAAVDETDTAIGPVRRRPRGKTRDLFKKQTTQGCYLNLNYELRTEDPLSFRHCLRITAGMFESLLRLVENRIRKQETVMQRTLSPGERLTLTLQFFATGHTFRDLGREFNIGERTVSNIITETCAALWEVLKCRIQTPQTEEAWKAVAKQFQDLWSIPHCIGVLDGMQIVLRKPAPGSSQCPNYKGPECIVFMAVVDADYRFLYVDAGTKGRTSDTCVWNKCDLKKRMDIGNLTLPPAEPLQGSQRPLPYVVVAGEAFGLQKYLMKPYAGSELSRAERIFNLRLSRARRIAENALGILLTRFKVFAMPTALSPQKVRSVALCVCALHNYLREHGDATYWPLDLLDKEDGDPGSIVPGAWRADLETSGDASNPMIQLHGQDYFFTLEGKQVQEELTDYFVSADGSVSWQDHLVEGSLDCQNANK